MNALLPLLSLLLAPASAEICYFDGGKGFDPQASFYELGGPACLSGPTLVFTRRYNASRYSENIETRLTDSFPGWGGAEEKCRQAVQGAKQLLDTSSVSYVIGKAVMLGPQVWKYKGGCASFRLKVSDLRREKGKDASYEDLFSAVGAERLGGAVSSDVGNFVDVLIERGSGKK